MPTLKPTAFGGEIFWLGTLESKERAELLARSLEWLDLSLAGAGDSV